MTYFLLKPIKINQHNHGDKQMLQANSIDGTYDFLCEAEGRKFHSEAGIWFRQKYGEEGLIKFTQSKKIEVINSPNSSKVIRITIQGS
jgi:hypothetical protein